MEKSNTTVDHKIFALGSNGSGQLGIGHKEDISVPKDVATINVGHTPKTDVAIKAGGNHTLMLLPNGRLLSAGDSSTGARGLTPAGGFREATLQPVKYFDGNPEVGLNVKLCAATWEVSIIVAEARDSESSKVYTFGTGNKGELGQGELIFRSPKASLLSNFPPKDRWIVDISASMGHVVVVLDNGEVWGWGNGRKGQLGEPAEIVYRPRKIEGIDFSVSRAVCGREFTFLVEQNSNSGSRCSLIGAFKWPSPPIPSSLPPWTDVAAGWGNIYVLKTDGHLLAYGRNDHGQLPAENLPVLKSLAVGSEHAMATTCEDEVIAWGWGEHGNCGPKTTDGDVKGTWNLLASSRFLPEGYSIKSTACGCATSWIQLVSVRPAKEEAE